MQLKKFRKKDIPTILSWIETESDMVQWSGPLYSWPMTQRQFKKHLEAVKDKPQTLYPFGFYHNSDPIGFCEISGYHPNFRSAQLSRVIITPKHRNKGHAQKMLSSVISFGFNELGLNRIGLGTYDFNEPAIKCYKKLGFKTEGTLRESSKVVTSYWNCQLMSLLRKEWLANI